MRSLLPVKRKIELVKRAKSGECISEICKQQRISRTILYKWIKKYRDASPRQKLNSLKLQIPKGVKHWRAFDRETERKVIKSCLEHPEYSIKKHAEKIKISPFGVWRILKRNDLNNEEKRKNRIRSLNTYKIRPRPFSEKLEMFKMYEEGKVVSDICRQYSISRGLFYRWLKRYKEAKSNVEALHNLRASGQKHWRHNPGAEKLILSIVENNPEYSAHKIRQELENNNKEKVLSVHGIHNILKRLGLSTYRERREFANALRVKEKAERLRHWRLPRPLMIIKYISYLPPPSSLFKNRHFRFFSIVFLVSFIFSFLSLNAINSVLRATTWGSVTGLFFAYFSLGFGVIFFLYSLKYYLNLAIVLSWSRKADRKNEGKIGLRDFVSMLFGINNLNEGAKQEEESLSKEDSNKTSFNGRGLGLLSDLSGVVLERNPFVSVHVSIYNEKRVIDRLLTACTSFDYPNYEVVVADDSTDETKQLIEKWRNHPRIKISHRNSREGYKGAALAQALIITDSKAEFILVFDADFIPYSDSITQFLKYFQLSTGSLNFGQGLRAQGSGLSTNTCGLTPKASAIAAVQGYQWHVLNKSENWITRGVRSEYSGSYVIERSGAEIYSGLKQISGSVYMIRRDVLEKIGWGTSLTEDFELTLRLYDAGYKVVYTPYIQTPAEAVSTIKRMIRQRMRWAEGHSFNIKRMFSRLLFGHWETVPLGQQESRSTNYELREGREARASYFLNRNSNKEASWVPSPLTLAEKLELIYLAPYYLQAAFFIAGTICWFAAEVIFQARLPFWTEVWGWSLVFSNVLALPLMNMIGLFMEESEEKDYMGLLSFVALTYIIAPFQAYAAVRGLIEKEEGPWFRTPKTGRITDTFLPGRIARLIRGLLGKPVLVNSQNNMSSFKFSHYGLWTPRFIPARASAFNGFNNFKLTTNKVKRGGNIIFVLFLVSTLTIIAFMPFIPSVKPAGASEREFRSISSVIDSNQDQKESFDVIPDGEIKGPMIRRYEMKEGQELEYIFHPEPRIRTKFENKEIDVTMTEIEGAGVVSQKESIKKDESYIYEEIVQDIDVKYIPKKSNITEEIILKSYKDIVSVDYDVRAVDLAAALFEDEIQFTPESGGEPIITFRRPYMYEEVNPQEKIFGIEYKLEKSQFGWKLKKVLTEEGRKWLADPSRVFPIIIDPTQVVSTINTGISPSESLYGSVQRKIAFSNRGAQTDAWYAVYQNGTRPVVERCLISTNCDQRTDWTVVSANLDVAGDTDGKSPNIFASGNTLYVSWFDNSLDAVQFRPIDTSTQPETLGQQCTGNDTGNTTAGQSSIAVDSSGNRYIAMTNPADSEWAVDKVPPTCSNANASLGSASNGNIGAGSGLSSGDPVSLVVKGTNLYMIYNDGDLSASVYNGSSWTATNIDVNGSGGANADGDFSVVTDNTDIWILQATGATGTELWQCANCTISGMTWSSKQTPFSGKSNGSFVSLGYISNVPSNTLVAMYMNGTGINEKVEWRTSNADNIAWGATYNYAFTPQSGGMDSLSSTMYVTNDTEFAAVSDEVTSGDLEFSTLPENTWMLFAVLPFVLMGIKKFRKRKY